MLRNFRQFGLINYLFVTTREHSKRVERFVTASSFNSNSRFNLSVCFFNSVTHHSKDNITVSWKKSTGIICHKCDTWN